MTGYLFDTSSSSLLSPDRKPLDETSVQAIRRHSTAIFLPTIAMAEIHAGICKLRRKGAERRAETLATWLRRLSAGFADRILPFDLAAAERAGALADAATAIGQHPGFADIAIAAIAASRDLVVVTENHRHFSHPGLGVTNLRALS